MKMTKIFIFYALSILLVPLTFIFVAFSDSKVSERDEFYGDNVKQWMNVKFSNREPSAKRVAFSRKFAA